MQVIIPVELTPAEYLKQNDLGWVRVPQPCPHCRKPHPFEALGHYLRWITEPLSGQLLRIRIRRFRSRYCTVTVSCLPDFCQPYRIVCNAAIGAYMAGERDPPGLNPWRRLLASYRRRFEHWLWAELGLMTTVGSRFGRLPPRGEPGASSWELLMRVCGGIAPATDRLVREFRITLFGRYRCHQAVRFASGK